ncbi:hypothetical protein FACS189468_9540 [Spirochaetia bacterium]|nr:hypothetical protein FACS189468_9540 [Spirochaetia bacterium]
MELTDGYLEEIRKAARTIDYGSVTINISANSDKLDLDVHRRIRIGDEVVEQMTSKKTPKKT